MRVLLVGSGGREDALAWALCRSPRLELLRCAPGNAGMARRGECIDIGAGDVEALCAHAVDERYDLVVVGPEVPLVAGLFAGNGGTLFTALFRVLRMMERGDL